MRDVVAPYVICTILTVGNTGGANPDPRYASGTPTPRNTLVVKNSYASGISPVRRLALWGLAEGFGRWREAVFGAFWLLSGRFILPLDIKRHCFCLWRFVLSGASGLGVSFGRCVAEVSFKNVQCLEISLIGWCSRSSHLSCLLSHLQADLRRTEYGARLLDGSLARLFNCAEHPLYLSHIAEVSTQLSLSEYEIRRATEIFSSLKDSVWHRHASNTDFVGQSLLPFSASPREYRP